MDISIEGIYTWFLSQVKYALFIGLLVALIITAFKRAWIMMIGVLVGTAFIGIFIVNPAIIIKMSTWIGKMVGIS